MKGSYSKIIRTSKTQNVNTKNPPHLSPGSIYLLTVARENDRHRALERNAALLTVLEFGKDLITFCKQGEAGALSRLLHVTSAPKNFLLITAAALHEIRRRLDEYLQGDAPHASPVRDFDRHALQGFAEALADLAWPERNASDFDGPTSSVFIARISRHNLEEMWRSTLQHYIANIFQDYFAALRIRENVRDVDEAAEVDLRLVDARILIDYVMRLYGPMKTENNEPEMLALALHQAIDQTLEGR